MDMKQVAVLLAVGLFTLLDSAQAICSSYNCDGYCCGYNTCCYSIYLTWWFWLIVVGVFLLKVSCITCYVRRRRQRANMFYIPAPNPVQQTTVHVAPRASVPVEQPMRPVIGGYPRQQAQMPPPYPGPKNVEASAPPYHASGSGQGPMANDTQDSRLNKDTQMLIG